MFVSLLHFHVVIYQVQSWNGAYKLLNPKKYVKCLALVNGKLYCGCQDNSIQEIDLASGTLSTIQSSSRNFMAKTSPIYALQVYDELLYSVGSSLDGTALKVSLLEKKKIELMIFIVILHDVMNII